MLYEEYMKSPAGKTGDDERKHSEMMTALYFSQGEQLLDAVKRTRRASRARASILTTRRAPMR